MAWGLQQQMNQHKALSAADPKPFLAACPSSVMWLEKRMQQTVPWINDLSNWTIHQYLPREASHIGYSAYVSPSPFDLKTW